MIQLSVQSFDEWRNAARQLLWERVSPQEVHWEGSAQIGLWSSPEISSGSDSTEKPDQVRVPAEFLKLARSASCYIDNVEPDRKWSVLYSLLWRLTQVDRRTLTLTSDPEVQRLVHMVRSVSRDCHKMKAFVRFQRVLADTSSDEHVAPRPQSTEFYTAWFEPEHAVVARTAPFFAKRFTGMHWSILTPVGCAHWNQETLSLSPGVTRPPALTDEFEHFWRTYYCHIFNPARLKEHAMQAEMPKKYWRYLPEAVCIKPLSSGASARMGRMLEAPGTDPDRVRKHSTGVRNAQDPLRRTNRH